MKPLFIRSSSLDKKMVEDKLFQTVLVKSGDILTRAASNRYYILLEDVVPEKCKSHDSINGIRVDFCWKFPAKVKCFAIGKLDVGLLPHTGRDTVINLSSWVYKCTPISHIEERKVRLLLTR